MRSIMPRPLASGFWLATVKPIKRATEKRRVKNNRVSFPVSPACEITAHAVVYS